MKKRLLLFSAVFLAVCGTVLAGLKGISGLSASTRAVGNGEIRFTTDANPGDSVVIEVKADGDFTIEGIDYYHPLTDKRWRRYTSKEVVIKGNVTELTLQSGHVTKLDLTKCPSLAKIDCSSNNLEELDVTKNAKLYWLSCNDNKLYDLDVKNNTALEMLSLANNAVRSIDISKNRELSMFGIDNNRITSLDFSNNPKLNFATIYSNNIKRRAMQKLVKSLPKVEKGFFYVVNEDAEHNVMTKQQVEEAKAKGWIVGKSNLGIYKGSDDDVKGTISLTTTKAVGETIKVKVNSIGNLDIEGAKVVSKAGAQPVQLQLTAQKVTLKGYIEGIECTENNITDIDITQCLMLSKLDCGNNELAVLDVSKNESLDTLNCNNNKLTELDITHNPTLMILNCNNNQLKGINLSKNPNLGIFNCTNNQITALDFSHNRYMAFVFVYGNNINGAAMDAFVNSLAKVKGAWLIIINTDKDGNVCTKRQAKIAKDKGWVVGESRLGEYDGSDEVSNASIAFNTNKQVGETIKLDIRPAKGYQVEGATLVKALKGKPSEWKLTAQKVVIKGDVDSLTCSENGITAIEVAECPSLKYLKMDDNALTKIDVKKNVALEELFVYNNKLDEIDVTQNTSLRSLGCSGNNISTLDVTHNTKLSLLACAKNKLTQLNLVNNKALGQLAIYENNINKQAMQAIVDALPKVNNGFFFVVSETNESNVCTKKQVKIAKDKGWVVGTSSWGYYEGSADVGNGRISFNTNKQVGETIKLDVRPADEYEVEGATLLKAEKGKASEWKLTAQKVVIKGDVDTLDCSNNGITALDVTQCPTLKDLSCHYNEIKELDLTHNAVLKAITCTGNKLSKLDISKNPKLTSLWCPGNQITALDLSHNPLIRGLMINNNRIGKAAMEALVDALPATGGQIMAVTIEGDENVMTKKQVAKAKQKGWQVYDNHFGAYEGSNDVGNGRIVLNTKLQPNSMIALDLAYTGDIEVEGAEWTIASQDGTYKLNVKSNEIIIKGDVTEFGCANNMITELDVTKCPTLVKLNCAKNEIRNLNLTNNSELTTLSCSANLLESLDFTANTKLIRVECFRNDIRDAAMETLVESLPVAQGTLVVVDKYREGNVITKEQALKAEAKGWKVVDTNNVATGINGVVNDVNSQEAEVFDLGGRRINRATAKGVVIVKQRGRAVKVLK